MRPAASRFLRQSERWYKAKPKRGRRPQEQPLTKDKAMNSLRTVAGRQSRLLLAFFVVVLCARATLAQETALDRYIAKPDPSYAWKLMTTTTGQDYKGFIIELTSQTWRSAAEVDRPVWKHWLIVVKPEQVTHDTALLFIGGGSNKDAMPTAA